MHFLGFCCRLCKIFSLFSVSGFRLFSTSVPGRTAEEPPAPVRRRPVPSSRFFFFLCVVFRLYLISLLFHVTFCIFLLIAVTATARWRWGWRRQRCPSEIFYPQHSSPAQKKQRRRRKWRRRRRRALLSRRRRKRRNEIKNRATLRFLLTTVSAGARRRNTSRSKSNGKRNRSEKETQKKKRRTESFLMYLSLWDVCVLQSAILCHKFDTTDTFFNGVFQNMQQMNRSFTK